MPTSKTDGENDAREIGRAIKNLLPDDVGFTLQLFTYEPGWTVYLSSARRPDAIRALEELLAQLKAGT